MTATGKGQEGRGKGPRAERLAAELRANLKKRKDQARARSGRDKETADHADATKPAPE